MNFNEDIVLENDKVLLRPLTLNDFEHLKYFADNETDIWQYSLMQIKNNNELKKYIERAVEARNQLKEYAFIVFDKTKNEYAGSTRFYDIQPQYSYMQLGFTWYGKEFQGTGLNKNCKYLLMQYVFENANYERLEFRADNRNTRSIAAMKSIGCVVEGVLRNHLPNDTGYRRDSIVLSILKNEWFESVKANLEKKIESIT